MERLPGEVSHAQSTKTQLQQSCDRAMVLQHVKHLARKPDALVDGLQTTEMADDEERLEDVSKLTNK